MLRLNDFVEESSFLFRETGSSAIQALSFFFYKNTISSTAFAPERIKVRKSCKVRIAKIGLYTFLKSIFYKNETKMIKKSFEE